MTQVQSHAALRCLLSVALPAVEALPIQQRADAYEGIAVAFRGVDEEIANQALSTAEMLRETQSAQLLFNLMLASEVPTGGQISRHASDLGERLFQARRQAGLKAKDVASQARISGGYYSDIEHGHKSPSADVIKRLALILPAAVATDRA